jgi:hypothetical protein
MLEILLPGESSVSTSFVTGRRKAWNIVENVSDAMHKEQGFKFALSENKFLMHA